MDWMGTVINDSTLLWAISIIYLLIFVLFTCLYASLFVNKSMPVLLRADNIYFKVSFIRVDLKLREKNQKFTNLR